MRPVGGEAFGSFAPVQLLTDSRQAIADPAAAVFFALRGAPGRDGARYVPDLYARGVRHFVVATDAEVSADSLPGATIERVPDPLAALQARAADHRRSLPNLPVVAITGSNGKTIVKEWLTQLLGPDERVGRSPRSWNSQLGVPLSVWGLTADHTLGIIEAGISQPGEMARLAAVIQPTLGLFTTLGPAHAEGFESMEAKLREKLLLFEGVERLYYCADQPLVHAAIQARHLPGFAWSFTNPTAAVQVAWLDQAAPHPRVRVTFRDATADLTLPFPDAASVENALHGVAFLLGQGTPLPDIQRRLDRLHPVAMRLERREGLHGCYLLDDSYSSDLASLQIALGLLRQQPRPGGRTLILSDVPQSALPPAELYGRVAALVRAHGVRRLIAIGPETTHHADLFARAAPERAFFSTTEDFLAHLELTTFRDETILVKGARAFGLERVVAALSPRVHGTVLDVNLDALVHNLNFFRARLRPETKLMVMVKAFAYGSGSYEVASLLAFHRVDYLAVAYADEGARLRQHGITVPILVLNPSPGAFPRCLTDQLEPGIYAADQLRELLAVWPENQPAPIHLKLDTGMRRLGFAAEDLPELLALLRENGPRLNVKSVFSHLAAADEARHDAFTHQQLASFAALYEPVCAVLGYRPLRHVLNSAGITRFPEAQFEMVRLGIGLYRVGATDSLAPGALRPVSTLRTTISQVKNLPAGATVGYGRRGDATDQPRRIATLAIGYADGYDRRFSRGVGEVRIRGQRAAVVGNVCMDMTMVDVTDIPAVRAGDVAEVFGPALPLTDLAARIGTIAYELLTNVSERVRRVFFSE
ncbi:MAG: bifunctional UDP-N-acetylmuramoyl-tripeptide:D-alanyl-D-alanine ligase/alanine racemase [Hymenobacteraceae bacterium]|nr:bifunctional UDP-N-acetylmuramoyl-tripeptide:D-alanyl-D-alanine ligase/alanine racemase [Hymenobacteraceae bacterium]